MHILKHSKQITESFAMNEIFNACRANEARKSVGNVVFEHAHANTYYATLYRYPGNEVLALATVDQWDV